MAEESLSESLANREITVTGDDGNVIYQGPVAKTLVYDGVTYGDYLLFAEPQLIDGKQCQLYNCKKNRWSVGYDNSDGYRRFNVDTKQIRRGAAMLYTFIGPPPEPNWICRYMKVTQNADRHDDRLDRIEWASPSTRKKLARPHSKNTAQSIPVIATHMETGEVVRKESGREMGEHIGSFGSAVTATLRKNRVLRGWNLRYDLLESLPGERWAELGMDKKKSLSSFGRVAHVTKAGLVESRSVAEEEYIGVRFDGVTHKVHRLVRIVFGTNEDRRLLACGYDVDHIDGDTHNNRLDNLQVLSRTEHMRKTHGKRVRVVDRLTEGSEPMEFGSARHAAAHIGMDPSTLREYLSGTRKHARYDIEECTSLFLQ
jgi:hypothetical protein